MKTIAVFTSGGDAPGMNACIRAIVRTGLHHGLQVYGILHGYQGMIDGQFELLKSDDVGNILQRGGTILKSARSKEFRTEEGMQKAYDNLVTHKIDGVIAIGGDGTFAGASEFSATYRIPFIGLPGTIDNDLIGTDYTIGYDTALNNVITAVDKIKDTAASHDRLFFVEVMGKDAGFIALRSGIGVGALSILIPETQTDVNELIKKLSDAYQRKKSSSIIIVAEGDDAGGAYQLAKKVKAKLPQYDTRVSVLGHLQRGGNPSALDRMLASQLGNEAVNVLLAGKHSVMVGVVDKSFCYTPFEKAIKHHDKIRTEFLKLAEILSA
ncbi:MAG: 6-phosphofructokinase [Flavobacteriales bacterium]|jgi:6-phosphofructokinase 1|nr:6-phosphofructokinase [Flavobacteriales bacterium]